MPMQPEFLKALFAANTDITPLMLLTISHPDFEQPARVVLNTEDVISRGERYLASYFKATPPLDSGDELASVTLEIDNVDREMTLALRTIQSPPKVTLEVVTNQLPDVVELGPFDFELKDVNYDTLKVTGTLAYEDILNEGFPSGAYNPSDFPGLFS